MARKADSVADDLMRRVVSGEIAFGTILPKESELSTHYGVNRSVVREAIKLLEVHDLLQPLRRRGTLVLDPAASTSPEVLRLRLSPRAGHVDAKTLADVLEIRAQLDEQMAVLACQRRTPEDLAEMRRTLRGLDGSIAKAQAYQQGLQAFSVALARGTHNLVFEMLVHWNARVQADLADVFLAVRPATHEHLQGLHVLVDLIEAGEVERARLLVRAWHEWLTPRLVRAAQLVSDAPMDMTQDMQPPDALRAFLPSAPHAELE